VENKGSILDRWLWEAELLRVFVGLMVLASAVLIGILYPILGSKAFFALVFAGVGLVCGIVYGIVGRKVERLRLQSLIVNGLIQSPGISFFKDDEIVLCPIVGERLTIRLADIASFRQVKWFNGKLLLFKTGFRLTVAGRGRLGVAVPNSYAELLRSRLR
jgi:hypothetical protein